MTMDLAVILSLPVIIICGIVGYRDGVVKRIIEIAGVLVALILTARFATGATPWVMDQTGLGEGPALLITWAGLFFIGLILSRLLATMLSKAVRLTILGSLDRLGGAVIGMTFGVLLVSVMLVAISQVPRGQAVQEAYDRDPVGRFIFYSAPSLYQFVQDRWSGGKASAMWQRALESSKQKADQAGEAVGEAVKETADDIKEEVKEKIEDGAR
jgi:uncharacterized membrane protein required for colicin V production